MDRRRPSIEGDVRRFIMIRFASGVVLALAVLLAAYFLEGGETVGLLGLTAFLITFFVPFFAVLAVWPFTSWIGAWKDALGKPTAAERSSEIWKFSEVACYLAGVLSSLAGGVLILNHWDRPPENLAHAFGVLLVGPLYGTFFALVCRILRARVDLNS
jgi:flagellar motor component MotA